jgi:carbonic anhydrase/acetyltransferase-like protein (isoleucine patch superfamily)
MSADPSSRIITIAGTPAPELDATAFVAPGAVVVGQVRLAAQSSVWYTSVLRAEAESITLGERSNLQDGVVCHVDAGYPVTVGTGVSVGHRAVLHGCTVEDDCLIGMGATILNGARIGANCIVGANALVTEGKVFPDNSLIMGVPAKALRELDLEAIEGLKRAAAAYVAKWRRYAKHVRLIAEQG